MNLYYNITPEGRRVLRQSISYAQAPTMPLGEFQEETKVWPMELQMLEDFAELDHGVDLAEIKDRWGSHGVEAFKRLHQAGYFSAEPEE